MNDFHLFSIHINNKDTNRAMLILRDKPESVARRIMIKARVNVPSCTGKSFWSWAQKYIIDTCRVDRGNNNVQPLRYTVQNTPVKPNKPESSSARYDKSMRFSGNVAGPLQHVVSDSSAPRDIRNRPDGVSTVLPGLGHKCVEKTGETSAERQQAMDMGRNNSANILSGVSQTRSLVCTEYPVRVRGRHTAAGVDSAVRKKGGVYAAILILAILPLLTPASYGLQGLVLAIALVAWLSPGLPRMYVIPETLIVIALLSLNGITHIITQPANTLLFAVLPTLLLPLVAISFAQNLTRKNDSRFMPRQFFYLSYAGHLLCYAAFLAVI